ncbi:MAG: RNA polymerase sigma factor [Pyrinomonadaceae bacterium]|nr:MAG: RNA polymerase sigma factor [Pyrinomonadaceae bacterium]
MSNSILRRIASKDRSAVEECINVYGGLVWALARKMCPSREDAEDAVQEIFIDIWKNAERFDETQSSEATFIAMIARRRLIDRIRKNKRQISTEAIEDLTKEPSESFNEQIHNSIEAKKVIEAFAQLRPQQKQVLHLAVFHGLSHQEIAKVTGMPIGTVKSHARRGLMKVREVLGLDKNDGLLKGVEE